MGKRSEVGAEWEGGRNWKQWLQAYEAPPLDAGKREALAAYAEKRGRELVGSKLYEDD